MVTWYFLTKSRFTRFHEKACDLKHRRRESRAMNIRAENCMFEAKSLQEKCFCPPNRQRVAWDTKGGEEYYYTLL